MTDPALPPTLPPIFAKRFAEAIPHVRELGIQLVHVDAEFAEARLPTRPEFLGDPVRGAIHTGVITTLIDSVAGVALFMRVKMNERIATLDLRVDYLRASRLGSDLICRAECYRMTDQIAFVRASVWQTSADEPVATALATFMRTAHSAQRDPAS